MPVVGTGLLFTEGQEDHLGLRKKMGRPFSIGNLKRLVGVFKGKAGELAGVVGGLVDGGVKDSEGGGDGKGEGVVVDGEFGGVCFCCWDDIQGLALWAGP